jgi:hypothetical protein
MGYNRAISCAIGIHDLRIEEVTRLWRLAVVLEDQERRVQAYIILIDPLHELSQ